MTGVLGSKSVENRARDLELAARMAAGDHMALAVVYTEHKDAVFTAAARLLGSARAADVAQDALLLAFERAGTFRGDAPLSAWIRRIAINLALRQLRDDRWVSRFRAIWSPERLVRPTVAEAIDLDRAIAELPSSLRAPFVLHALEGYSYGEIASLLGINEAACRQRLHRARARLASRLSDHDPR